MSQRLAVPETVSPAPERAVFNVLLALSVSHLLNDTIQGVLPAIYPLLKSSLTLSFTQIGLITLVFQGTASLLQPLVGTYTDRRPLPYSLATGMAITLGGLVLLAQARHFHTVLLSSALIGMGSAIFHPEASRLARVASGGRHGFAQSFFQVGGNLGSSLGPLLAALIVMPHGQSHVLWFTLLALLAILILLSVGRWYGRHLSELRSGAARRPAKAPTPLNRPAVIRTLLVLMVLIFSKYIYLTCFTSYYTFFLIDRFQVEPQTAQLLLFVFLFAVAAGTIVGGPVGDRFGRKGVIWISILGVAPFALLLPSVGLGATIALTVIIGLVLASAFSAILVYAQELVPGRVGLISGLFFGLAFGIAGIGSAILGSLADRIGIQAVFAACAYLPLLGLLAAFLPSGRTPSRS